MSQTDPTGPMWFSTFRRHLAGGTPIARWFIMEHPIEIDHSGVPPWIGNLQFFKTIVIHHNLRRFIGHNSIPKAVSRINYPHLSDNPILWIEHLIPATMVSWCFFHRQRLDPSFTTVPNLPPAPVPLRFARRTAEALRLCSEEIDRSGLFPPVSTALLVLTAGASDDAENVPGLGRGGMENMGKSYSNNEKWCYIKYRVLLR